MRYWLIGVLLLASVPTEAKQHRVSLTWTASAGCMPPSACVVSGYHVYKSKGSGPFVLANAAVLTTTYFTDKNVYAGQVLHYVVTAVTSTGIESAYSNQAVAKIPWR